jgi:hypothetical protein
MEIGNCWASYSQPMGMKLSSLGGLVTGNETWRHVRAAVVSHPVVSDTEYVACEADYESLEKLLRQMTLVRMSVGHLEGSDEEDFFSLYGLLEAGMQQASRKYCARSWQRAVS